MADPTILEYLGKTDDLEQKLVRLKVILETVNKVIDTPHELNVNIEQSLDEIGQLKNRLLTLQEDFNKLGSVKIRADFAQSIEEQINRSIHAEQALYKEVKNTADKILVLNKGTKQSFVDLGNGINNALKPPPQSQGLIDQLQNLNKVVRLIAFSRVAQEIKSFATDAVEASVELESLRNSFTAVIGTSEGADKALADLLDTSQTFGRSFLDVTENFLRFKVAGDAAKLSAEGTDAIFKSIIITSSALNQSSAQLNRTFTAFEQILSKGVLSAEEVRRQLGNALPGAFSIVARAVGVTNSELEKLLRSGTLLSTEVAPKIAAELLKTFSKQAIANVSSTRAEFERFNNELLLLRKAVGDGVTPVLREMINEFDKLQGNANFQEITDQSHQLAISLKAIADLLINIVTIDITGVLGGTLEIVSRSVLSVSEAVEKLSVGIVSTFSETAAAKITKYWNSSREQTNEAIEAVKQWVGASSSGADVATEHNQKAAKSVAEITLQIEKLKTKNERVFDGLLNELEAIPGETGKAAKSLNDISDAIFAIQKESKEVEASDFWNDTNSSEQLANLANRSLEFAEKLEKVKQELIDAGEFSGKLAVQIVNLEKQFGHATIELATFNNELDKLGVKSEESIRGSITGILDYVSAIEDGGNVTTAQADLIVKAIKSIKEEIDKLPPSQREAFLDLENSLDKVEKKYTGFTTQAGKDADKLRKETEKTFSGLADSLGDIFDKLREKISGATGGDEAKKNLQDLQKEFDALNTKSSEGTLSVEELNRFNQLSGEIHAAQLNATGAIKEAFQGTQVEVAKAFEDMILHNDKLIKGLSLLPAASQQAFLNLVSGFDELAKTSKIGEVDLEDFGKKISEIFQAAGVDLSGFVTNLSQTATLVDKIKAQIAGAQNEAITQTKDGGINTNTGTIQAPSIDNTNQINETKKHAQELADIWTQTSAGTLKTLQANEDVSKTTKQLTDEYGALNNVLKFNVSTIAQQQTAATRMAEIYAVLQSRDKEIEIGTQKVAEAQDILSTSTKHSSSGIAELAEATRKANEASGDMFALTGKVSENIDQLAGSTEQAGITIKNSSVDLTSNSQALDNNAQAIEGLRQHQIDYTSELTNTTNQANTAGNKIDDIGKKGESTADKLDKAGPKMEDSLKPFKALMIDIETIFDRLIDIKLPKLIELTLLWRKCADGTETP